MHQWMPGDILLKADKMTMAHSLELRVPLLDKELMGVAEQVPTKYLITDENTKYAFRQAAGRHLPKEWYDREKLGFQCRSRSGCARRSSTSTSVPCSNAITSASSSTRTRC